MSRIQLTILTIATIIPSLQGFAQNSNCDCKSNFEWVKATFEESDAGFRYILDKKGQAAYDIHNQLIEEKVKAVENRYECANIINDWLHFFRKSHIGFSVISDENAGKLPGTEQDWETFPVDTAEFKKYLENKQSAGYEGIFVDDNYQIGIKKEGGEYIGFIIESKNENWKKEEVKLKIIPGAGGTKSIYYMGNKSKIEGNDAVELWENSVLRIGNYIFNRTFPETTENQQIKDYIRSINAQEPFLEKIDENTLYFRVPSFMIQNKPLIDDVLFKNRDRILNTENLIIDIRNNGGGSDGCYGNIIPFLYTSPIRKVVVEFLSTKLTNQKWLEYSQDTTLELRDRKIMKERYELFEKHLGEFVNPWGNKSWTNQLAVVHPYPKNVGIIINGGVASASEEFLMEAKQSFKVKLFGTNTMGALDVSNVMSAKSPGNDFELYYTSSKSFRLPGFSVDDTGIQPDFLIDNEIPDYQWLDYVKKILDLNQ
ncbi:MAG: hypothetical protein LBB64_00305 [Dysgonamonadaceae bacterium]|jgi:C-terminal processing protease CtpA/Prc|nr:hypothetical protein [Dysgonamonadaceae bacterium]